MPYDPTPIIEASLVEWGIGSEPALKLKIATEITKWFDNFLEAEKEVVAHLVHAMNVVTVPSINSKIQEISEDLIEFLGDGIESTCVLPLGLTMNDSGAQFIYGFDKQLSDGSRSITFDGTVEEAADSFETIVLVDDIVGSGGQAIKAYKRSFEQLDRRIIYAPIFAFDYGLQEINTHAGYDKIFVGLVLHDEDRAFSNTSIKFPDQGLRSELKDICEKYGKSLYEKGPLGYENTQALISFPHNCPNNTLPVIWAGRRTDEKTRGVRWHPLRERIKTILPQKPSPVRSHATPADSELAGAEDTSIDIAQKYRQLTDTHKKVHCALALYKDPFTLDILEAATTGSGGQISSLDYLEKAESLGIIDKLSSGGWKLVFFPERALLQVSNDERRAIAGRIVTILLNQMTGGESGSYRSSDLDIDAAQNILNIYDRFQHFDRRKQRLQQAICRNLESFGSYHRLIDQLVYERSHTRQQSVERYWYDFRIARTQYYTGDIEGAFERISRLYHEIADRVVPGDWRYSRTIEVKTSIIRQLCQILADTGYPDIAVRLLLKVVSETDISLLSHTVAMMNMLGLSRALALAGFAKESLSIGDDIITARYSGFLTPMTKAVSGVHKAIALSETEQPNHAIKELGPHIDFFRAVDKRACCWALTERAACHLKTDAFDNAAEDILDIINISREMDILTKDIVTLLDNKKIEKELPELWKEILAFNYEHHEIISRISIGVEGIYGSRLVEHIALELDVELDDEIYIDIGELKLLTPLAHPKLKTQVMRTFLNAERSKIEELENKLDNLFIDHRNEEEIIFSSPVFNNFIVEACKKRRVLDKKYIYPYRDLILKQYGGILLFYARYFELVDDLENAEIFLKKIKYKRSFAYLNVEANVAGKKDFDEGLLLNIEVLRKIPDFFHQQRARIHNNIAHLIYNNKKRQFYKDAINHCEISIKLNRNPKFFFPKNLLLTLRLEVSTVEKLGEVLLEHKERFRPPDQVIELAVQNIRNRERRESARAMLK